MDSFERFQSVIKLYSRIFERPALVEIYNFLTSGKSGNSAKTSFIKPNQISPDDRHQCCLAIQRGATAAIRSVRRDFEGNPDKSSIPEYLQNLMAGTSSTQLLISVKGTHHPLNASLVTSPPKGGSLIKIIRLYTKTLQGSYSLTGSQPTSSMKKAISSKMLTSH